MQIRKLSIKKTLSKGKGKIAKNIKGGKKKYQKKFSKRVKNKRKRGGASITVKKMRNKSKKKKGGGIPDNFRDKYQYLTTDTTSWTVTDWTNMIQKIIKDESLKDEDSSDLKNSLDNIIKDSGSKEVMSKAFKELFPLPIAKQIQVPPIQTARRVVNSNTSVVVVN